jgi:hypothetical protein
MEAARSVLGDTGFERAFAEGRTTPFEELVTSALADAPASQ